MDKSDLQRFRNECVAAHNFYRAAHGTPPLCWSTRLAESAQAWAEQLASTTGSLRYSSAKDVGENLTLLWGSELNGQKITRIWYEEGKHFDYKKPRVNSRTRSFCQVVWEGTRELGAGAAITKHGKQIVVARYFPPMNKKNVARNVKKAKSTRENEQPLTFDTRWSSLYVGLKEFHEECLSAHNEYRIRHGAAPLHWSAELAWEAQQWAENLAQTGELRHNEDDTVGENLAGMVGGELSGREAVDMWYEEIESYDFESPGYSEDTSNFTQVVWVASENLGVGRAIDGELCVVVAFYEPPGNMERYFGDNVLRLGSNVRERKSKEPKGFIPPAPDLEGFRLECLVTHNYFRARHGSPPLVLNSTLTDEAQYWAERLLVTGASEGLDNSRIGISVAVLENKHISGIKVSELWYKQILSYDFNSPGFSTETLDFSQLVWLSTRKLGVGKATGAEGVTVVVARYEPVGNIDGLFVQNVKRRGHERGSSEPMIFHVDYKYRIRTDSKSSNSFLSWEHEDAPTWERGGDFTKSSCQVPHRNGLSRAKFLLNRLLEDLDRCRNSCSLSPPLSTAASLSWSDFDHLDVNKNMVQTADKQEPTNTLAVTDAFTRLVWIDPNSPTLQRKGVADGAIRGVDEEEEEEEEEEGNDKIKADEGVEDENEMVEEQDDEYEMEDEQDQEDARTAFEEENRVQTEEEPSVYQEEAELEEADLFSDPEDDLYQHVCEIRRSLSLDSEGTEPEAQKGNVLSKVAFFETFQRSFETQSLSNSESSFRRSLIQDELEELASRPRLQASHEEHEQAQMEHEEEPECQLEFDDIFPAHREEDEIEVHVDEHTHDEAGEGDDESLVSVSDTEDVLDSTDYGIRNVGAQDYELENKLYLTHEFIEEEPSTLEIFDFSDEEASHQYADLTEQPLSSTKSVVATTKTGTEFQKKESWKLRKEETPHSKEDTPENYSKESFQTSEASVQAPETFCTKPLDPDLCPQETKQDDAGDRMEEVISTIGLLSVEENIEDSNDLLDFNDTIEGKLLTGIVSSRNEYEVPDEQTLIDETCEALVKDSVESEIDFDELFARLERDETENERDRAVPQTVMEIETSQSPDNLCEVITRDHVGERSMAMERISSDLEVQTSDQSSVSGEEKEKELEPDVTLHYEYPTLVAQGDIEVVAENIEAVEKNHKPERTVDVEELQANIDSLLRKDTSESAMEEESCEAVVRDHNAERARGFEEIGLISVLPDDTYSVDEPAEPLRYRPAPKSTVRKLHEVTEIIDAEVRQDARSEINFEQLFLCIDKNKDDRFYDEMEDQCFDSVQDNSDTALQEELCEAVFRDYDQEHAKDLHEEGSEIQMIPVPPEDNETFHKPVEPLPYDQAPVTSTDDQSSEVTEVLTAEVRRHLRSEINVEETFSHLKEQTAEYDDEIAEKTVPTVAGSPSRASLYVVEDTVVDDVEHCSPSTSAHISHETESDVPTKEIVELNQLAEPERQASLYKEEETFVIDVTAEVPSSPKHIAGEGVNLERMESVGEVKERKEEERASLIVDDRELVTKVPSESLSLQSVAGEVENVALFEQAPNETEIGHFNRASLFREEVPDVQKLAADVFSSPRHISSECENVMFAETEVLEQRDEERASLYIEENTTADSMVIKEASLYPLFIACESQNFDPKTQIEEREQPKDETSSLMYSEEVMSFAEIKYDTPLSPKHIACECTHADFVEKVESKEPIAEENRALPYWEDEVQAEKIGYDIPASPKHVAGESLNTKFIEEVRELTEDEKRASLFMEEETTVSRVTTGAAAAMHVAHERVIKESTEEIIEGEPYELEEKSSKLMEEDSVINEVIQDTPSSPKHIFGEIQTVDSFEDVYEGSIEERQRASLVVEEAVAFDDLAAGTPSSPKHIAGEITNRETFEETEEVQEYENKRTSIFVEENISHGYVSLKDSSRKHVAAEILNSELLEVGDDKDSPESDYGEHFEEFERTCGTGTYVETPKAIYVAGEVQNRYTHGEAAEDILQLDESVKYEDFQHTVTTSILAQKPQPPVHIAEELTNIMPQEELSEEGKTEEEVSAEEIEETQFQTTTVLLKSPQSLLSIAAAVLEQNIEASHQEAPEEFTTKTEVTQQYSEEELNEIKIVASEDVFSNASVAHEIKSSLQRKKTVITTVTSEHSPVLYVENEATDDVVSDNTKVPVILIDLAGKISDEEDDDVYLDEERQETDAKNTKGYETETSTAHPTEEQCVESHAAAEFCVSEVVLEDSLIIKKEEFVEPFEESEEGSVSELLSESSSSPLHVSSELKDFQDFQTINEEYGSERYHAISYEEGDYVSEITITKGLPPLFITEELSQDAYKENILKEESTVIETAREYGEVKDALPTQTSVGTSQLPLQTTTDVLDSKCTEGVMKEEDEPDGREFADKFIDTGGINEKMTNSQSDLSTLRERVDATGTETAEDETDNAQKLGGQEVVSLPAEQEQVVHREEILQEVWEVEVTKGSQHVETFREKHKKGQMQRSVEKSSYLELESKESHSVSQTQRGEIVLVGEQGEQMEVSHKMETKVEVMSTRTVQYSSSTTLASGGEVTTKETKHHLKTNGACISREEVKNIEEVSFTEIQGTRQQRLWIKEEMENPLETNDELSESILERETKDQESERFERELSQEETEVRLMKSEVLEYKAVELKAQLDNPRITVERETTLVRAFVVPTPASEGHEQTLMREDSITAILKDDEVSLEKESEGEKFEEEIDIMRVDEALSEQEFRGEGADKGDSLKSRSSKGVSVDATGKWEERESAIHRSDQKNVPYEGETGICDEDPLYEEECEVRRVDEALGKSDDGVVGIHACEEVEVTALRKEKALTTEASESPGEMKLRVQSPVFEEELEISALPAEDRSYQEDQQEKDKDVEQRELLEEEVEVSAITSQEESPVSEVELEVEHVEKQKTEEDVRSKEVALFEEELEISTVPNEEEQIKTQDSDEDKTIERTVILEEDHPIGIEERDGKIVENVEHVGANSMRTEDQTDKESANHSEISDLSTQREPLDLSQVDLYEEDESGLETRYYVELSSSESLEPHYEEMEDQTCYTEKYVRQGDPLEENLEEFILVKYGDEFESSGEEDISDHREIYVIPEEENDVENRDVESARDDKVNIKDPKPESFFREGSENTGLEEIRESPEFEMDDSDELDEEEQRQLEEYERLESFVILEEKLSQVESDDDEIADLEEEVGDENVFHSDVHSSSEETLHEDELAQTMIASSIQQASAFTEPEYIQQETSHDDGFTETQEQISTEKEEQSVERSPSRKEDPRTGEQFKAADDTSVEVAHSKSPTNEEARGESLSEDQQDQKGHPELSRAKEEKTEQQQSSDSSGEQSVSSEGSLSATPSVDLEGLDNFEQDCLLQHNLYRRQHRVKPLKWSEELAEGAKRWSEHLASLNALESFEGKDVGENLMSAEGKELSALEVVDMWYKEVEDYNFEDPAFNAKCGRFTQVVWASSREFGAARCLASDGTQYIVARYKPSGNILGEFKENVKPPRDPSSRLKRRRSSARRRSRSGMPSTPAEKEKFKTECVISHNYYRTFHNAPALRWSPLLAAEAQNYAERLAKTDSLTHSGQKDRGENLAYTWDSPLSARAAIDMWYDEVQDYDFDSPGFSSDTGHFTQLVWVGTEEFGMGMAVASDGRNIVVGKYFPPGNIVGQFKENVRSREIEGIP